MARVGIVTDSTCDIDPAELASLDVEMVPLTVFFGEESYLDWVDLGPAEFYRKLAGSAVLPKTSQPSPAAFTEAYARLAEAGCDGIVSIHLSAALSGTFQSASIAAEESAVPVHVVDTKRVSQCVGLIVRDAVRSRDAGLDAAAVAERAQRVAAASRIFFVLDTLDYLVKGGRAGRAQGLAASLLNIKPVLDISADGVVEPFKKVKGRKKALAELAAHVAEDARERGRLTTALLHACADPYVTELSAELHAAGADTDVVTVGLVGAVIGTYAGPGAVGCAYFPERLD